MLARLLTLSRHATHVGSQRRSRKSFQFRMNRPRSVRHRRPAPRQGVHVHPSRSGFPPRCCVPQKNGAPIQRVPPVEPRSRRRIPDRPRPPVRVQKMSPFDTVPAVPVAPGRSKVPVALLRLVTPKRVECDGLQRVSIPAAGVSAWHAHADRSAFPPRPPQAPSRVDTSGRLKRQPDASAMRERRPICRRRTAYRDRKSTRLNSSHTDISRMPSSA